MKFSAARKRSLQNGARAVRRNAPQKISWIISIMISLKCLTALPSRVHASIFSSITTQKKSAVFPPACHRSQNHLTSPIYEKPLHTIKSSQSWWSWHSAYIRLLISSKRASAKNTRNCMTIQSILRVSPRLTVNAESVAWPLSIWWSAWKALLFPSTWPWYALKSW